MDEQMNNNGYQYQPTPGQVPNQNKDGVAIAVFVLGIVSICGCCVAWGGNQSCVCHCIIGIVFT